VLGFGREVLDYQPDAVLVYTGHNEYYGALGVGSTSYLGRNPYLVRLVLKLRELRLMQLMSGGVTSLGRLFSGAKVDPRETLMQRMAAEQQIPYGSEVYRSGIHQFETNLNDLLRLLNERRVPVLVSTLVSNEKDLRPFISAPGEGEASADGQFRLGQQAYGRGDFARAKAHYVRAKELDLLRFRAPEALNAVIRRLVPRYPSAHLVDAKAAFQSHSPHGIVGGETLLEHVHPNLLGYALLSDAFYTGLQRAEVVAPRPDREMSLAELRARMPVTRVDSLRGAYEIGMLKEGWPFNEPLPPAAPRHKSVEEKLAGALAVKQLAWGEAMRQLQTHYLRSREEAAALRVTEALALEYPHEPGYWAQAGGLCMNLGQFERAVFYLKKSFDRENTFATAKNLFVTLLKLDRPEEARVYLAYAAAHNTSATPLDPLLGLVDRVVALKAAYRKDSARVPHCIQLAEAYLQFANGRAARKYVDEALRLEPRNPAALALLARIEALAP
jgi:tetratricopeptide (TPR) repeat protein